MGSPTFLESLNKFIAFLFEITIFSSYVLLVCQHVIGNLNFLHVYLFCNHIWPKSTCGQLPLLVQYEKIEKKNIA